MFFFILIIFLLGLALGSFANCLLWRLYKEEKINGRSYCPNCRHDISWYDNIPLLSYLFLRGRCRHCHLHISWQYPIVELAMGLLFVFFWWQQFDFSIFSYEQVFISLSSLSFCLNIVYLFLATWVLLSVLVFDWRFYLISTILVWPAIVLFVILNILMGASVLNLFLGMVLAAAFFLLQFVLTRGKGLGEGDIWLGVLLGSIFSQTSSLLFSIFSAYILGSLFGLFLIILNRKSWGSKLPLGVFLALGALITLIFETKVSFWFNLYF